MSMKINELSHFALCTHHVPTEPPEPTFVPNQDPTFC